MRIERLAPGDEHLVVAAADVFDHAPTEAWAAKFLAEDTHHLLLALSDANEAIGFVSGVETTHPDKGTEMFLYELSVAEAHRNRGVGRELVRGLAELARERGCYGMWVLTDTDNAAALAAYRAAGAGSSEPRVMLSWEFTKPKR